MAARIHRLRPKGYDRVADALQLALELPLGEAARSELTEALSSYAPKPWPYVMLNRSIAGDIQRKINAGPRPGTTLSVWMAALFFAEYGSGRIAATRQQIAEQAGTDERGVSRALSRLVELGALTRAERGRYMLHPSAAWSGSLASRDAAERRFDGDPA